MELHDTFFLLSVQANLDGQDPKVIVNKIDNGIKLKEICKRLEFETGKIRAHSILEYYTVEDGFLVDKEGNQISLSCDRYSEIKFVKIKEPAIQLGDREVGLQYVKDVTTLLNMENPAQSISGLSKEEKKALNDERELLLAEAETKRKEQEALEAQKLAEEEAKAAEEARKIAEEEETKKTEAEAKKAEAEAKQAEEDAKKAEAEAQKAREEEEEAKRQAEESARKAELAQKEALEIKQSESLLSQRDYDKSVTKTGKLGMKVYVKDKYHFFYGTDVEKRDPPFILVKRGAGKYEDLPCAPVDEDFDKGIVEFEFDDNEDEMFLKFNIKKEELIIEPY